MVRLHAARPRDIGEVLGEAVFYDGRPCHWSSWSGDACGGKDEVPWPPLAWDDVYGFAPVGLCPQPAMPGFVFLGEIFWAS